MIPRLDLGAGPRTLSVSSSSPLAIPALNLSAVPKVNDPSPTSERPIDVGAHHCAAPPIPLFQPAVSLSLESLRTGAPPPFARSEVAICVPYATFKNKAQFASLEANLTSRFGRAAVLTQIRLSPEEWVIENSRPGSESAIPSLQTLDAAFQDIEHCPFLIDHAEAQGAALASQIEQARAEIEAIRAEKERLAIETAVLRERVRTTQEEGRRFAEAAVRVKRDFDAFVQRLGQ
jgi:hypothetical protein